MWSGVLHLGPETYPNHHHNPDVCNSSMFHDPNMQLKAFYPVK